MKTIPSCLSKKQKGNKNTHLNGHFLSFCQCSLFNFKRQISFHHFIRKKNTKTLCNCIKITINFIKIIIFPQKYIIFIINHCETLRESILSP